LKKYLKIVLERLPAFIGVALAGIDFRFRLGNRYVIFKIKANYQLSKDKVKMYEEMKTLVEFSEMNILFYKDFYKKNNFSSMQLKSFDDLKLIPIVTKEDFQKFNLAHRVLSISKGIVTNTGGTSGQPLKLLLDTDSYAREWAHMHTIWEKLGYKTSCIKLTFRGMNLGTTPIKYNFIHNEFQVNAYCDVLEVIVALEKLLKKYKIEYLHGYPSAIYEFVKYSSNNYPDVVLKLRKNLKGIFFGSEYPAPVFRSFVEDQLKVPTISWYGHTEMAVLAYEKDEPFVYHPFQSYGFTEAVEIDGKQHLVGTTIHNQVGPLIRYDTGDIIEPLTYKDGVLESFRISEGRTGEFVVDSNGRNISLTALIFGRHHDLFGSADFVQVSQDEPGKITVYVTTQDKSLAAASLFDASGINMTFEFILVDKPFKTPAGKVPLVVKPVTAH
jgi:phenylacetate-CoA ligase